jgi:hypothetical protein
MVMENKVTETQFTSKLTKALREQLEPGYIVWKHADGYTAGIPDISISWGRDTLWIEVKLANNPKLFEPLQMAMLKKLEGHYVIWDTKKRIGYRFHSSSAPKEGQKNPAEFGYGFKELVQNILNEVR